MVPRLPYETVQLERVRVAVRNVLYDVGPTVSASADVEWHAEQMALEVSAYVLSERLPPERFETSQKFPVSWPDGWWQMWLHEHRSWPVVRSWLKRRPVRMHTEWKLATVVTDLERYRSYPKARVQLPEDRWGAPVLASVVTSRVRWSDYTDSTGGNDGQGQGNQQGQG